MIDYANPSPEQLLSDPNYLLFDLQLPQQKALWVRVNPGLLKEASFLDQRVLPKVEARVRTPLDWLKHQDSITVGQRRLRWIFHCGHVGSTLLSRLLDSEQTRVLREPQVLRKLATSRLEASTSQAPWTPDQWWHSWAAPSLDLLSRHEDEEQGVLIKATSSTAHLMSDILQRRQQDLSIALAMPLDLYLAAMSLSPAAQQDIQGFAAGRLQQISSWLQRPVPLPGELNLHQIMAVSWLVSLWPMAQAIENHPDRCRWLGFEKLMTDTKQAAHDAAKQLDWPEPVAIAPLMNTYAKAPGQQYNSQRRWEQISAARVQLKSISEDLLAWLHDLMQEHKPISRFLDTPLSI